MPVSQSQITPLFYHACAKLLLLLLLEDIKQEGKKVKKVFSLPEQSQEPPPTPLTAPTTLSLYRCKHLPSHNFADLGQDPEEDKGVYKCMGGEQESTQCAPMVRLASGSRATPLLSCWLLQRDLQSDADSRFSGSNKGGLIQRIITVCK